jgi:hypothetical protein
MSISDVVVLRCNGDITAHYVGNDGYVELPSFTGDERTNAAAHPNAEVPPPEVCDKIGIS